MATASQPRNVPDDVHREVVQRAAAAGLSLPDYLLGEGTGDAVRAPLAEVLARADARRGGGRAARTSSPRSARRAGPDVGVREGRAA